MKSILHAAALSLLLLPSAARAADPRALLARAKEAAGGDVWNGVRTLHLKVSVAAGGLAGTSDSWQDVETGRYVDAFQLGPVTGAEGFDGTVTWEVDPSGMATVSDSGDAREGTTDEAYRRSLSYWYPDRRPATIADAGERSEDDRRFHVLQITPEGGRPFELWIDAGTFLFDRTVEKTANETRTTFFSDYRAFNGIRIPFVSRTTNGEAKYDQTQTIEGVEVNAKLDAARFTAPKNQVNDFAIAGGKTSAELPFRLINNHLYVQVSLDGKPLQMLFDSGGLNLVTPAAVARLGLKAEGTLQMHGVGGSEDVSLTRVKELRAGDVALRDQAFYVLPLQGLSEVEGMDVDGIIGYEVFKRFVVRIDYAHQMLRFTHPEAFTAPAAGTVVRFTFDERTPQVEGKIDGISGTFTIDTGSRSSLTLNRPFAEDRGLRAKYGTKFEAMSGWGVGGGVRSAFARAGVLELGGVRVPAPVTDIVVGTKGSFNNRYLAGNVGGGVLKRFTVTFDYTRRRLIFEPNASTNAEDVWDRAGLWLNRANDGFEVEDVVAGGPAAEAGLEVGDTILSFDGKTGHDLSVADARQLLKSAPGTRVAVKVRRQGAEREATLTLRDLV